MSLFTTPLYYSHSFRGYLGLCDRSGHRKSDRIPSKYRSALENNLHLLATYAFTPEMAIALDILGIV
jgi:hypothetical protein